MNIDKLYHVLRVAALALAIISSPALAQEMHVESGNTIRLRVVYQRTDEIRENDITRWDVFVAQPPNVEGQRLLFSSVQCSEAPNLRAELVGEDGTKYWRLSVPTEDNSSLTRTMSVKVTYEVELTNHQLMPGPAEKLVTLSKDERQRWTKTSDRADFGDPRFQWWLDHTWWESASQRWSNLRKSPAETAYQFVRRSVREILRWPYQANNDTPSCVNAIYRKGGLRCEQANLILIGILRANGIPARELGGLKFEHGYLDQLAEPRKHSICQFFCAEMGGWVRADATAYLDLEGGRVNPDHYFNLSENLIVTQAGLEQEITDETGGRFTCLTPAAVSWWHNGSGPASHTGSEQVTITGLH